ncbi:nuclear transport factor 2 family protein [Mycobacterium sp. 94-17]|uniref:nuclear transport factor 2 family protein n=1 Tax=Mycobacterium sp. 94-17 TaxID=2986147 RepID=UPI002D1F2736|nr:nuclear transport factor 2 family protein [Mycobacterium sp. 94-17]MEB4211748.1 nuclear transport factor 2 family protein [Mycobacterium sp. 94-17]
MSDSFTRAEIKKFWAEWLEVNREAERSGDWGLLADCYVEDATYGWMFTPDEHFMAMGREEIRRWAVGSEMQGLECWHYDYMATVLDEENAMIVGFWKQRSGVLDDNGQEYEIRGIGGSWFGVARDTDGNLRFAWQRDWFDLGSTAHTFIEIAKSGKASQAFLERIAIPMMDMPGRYHYADLPSTLWPPKVEEGQYITQNQLGQ